MRLKLVRYGYSQDSTGGLLFVNDKHFCYTCEDERREIKVPNETCIPAGEYEIKLRYAGGMNESYKLRYSFHRGMLHLQDVPGFEWIYLHVGNNDNHTSGCVLVGLSGLKTNGEYVVGSSVKAYSELYFLITTAMDRGEQVFIEVVDL